MSGGVNNILRDLSALEVRRCQGDVNRKRPVLACSRRATSREKYLPVTSRTLRISPSLALRRYCCYALEFLVRRVEHLYTPSRARDG